MSTIMSLIALAIIMVGCLLAGFFVGASYSFVWRSNAKVWKDSSYAWRQRAEANG